VNTSLRHLRTLRGRVALTFAVVLVAGWFVGEEIAAIAITRAPNAGKPEPAAQIGEIRVAVGPPSATIACEIVDAPSPRATVFVLHGIRDSRASMRGWGAMLASAGIRAVLVDLRGHGRSTGDVLSYGVFDAHDLSIVLDALEARGERVGRVGVLGVSYGAATAIEWAGADPRIEAVVAIAPFESLARVVPGYAPVPLPNLFVRGALAAAGRRGGYDPDLASPLAAIAVTRAPVLLIHGKADERIAVWHSEDLRAKAPDHVELVEVDGETHESITDDRTGTIRTRAPAWFHEHLER
jgi:pimeloyl-ACP methyl ester carboxylesterase